MPKRDFEVALDSKREIAPGVVHFVFKRSDAAAFDYIPGQFVTVLIQGPEKVLRRSYSLAAAPSGAATIEFAAAYVKDGVASELLFNMQPGDTLTVMGPAGRLVLPTEMPKRLVFVATGTGITPFRAMLPALAEVMAAGVRVDMVQGVRTGADLLYGDEFLAMASAYENFFYHPCFSRELPEVASARQCYVQQCFKDLELDPDADLVYLCGNPNMIDDAFATLTEQGFATQSVRREKYISSN